MRVIIIFVLTVMSLSLIVENNKFKKENIELKFQVYVYKYAERMSEPKINDELLSPFHRIPPDTVRAIWINEDSLRREFLRDLMDSNER